MSTWPIVRAVIDRMYFTPHTSNIDIYSPTHLSPWHPTCSRRTYIHNGVHENRINRVYFVHGGDGLEWEEASSIYVCIYVDVYTETCHAFGIELMYWRAFIFLVVLLFSYSSVFARWGCGRDEQRNVYTYATHGNGYKNRIRICRPGKCCYVACARPTNIYSGVWAKSATTPFGRQRQL